MDEFDCSRCGRHVVLAIPVIEQIYPLCATCSFLSTIEDPTARASVERLLDDQRMEKNGP